MTKAPSRKRPCCICRKWFPPDVRQKERQRTCSPECRREHHRRQCAEWNKKNKESAKSNYLNKKLEKIDAPQLETDFSPPVVHTGSIPKSRIRPILPRDIVQREIGTGNLVILDYLAEQILARIRDNPTRYI